MSKAVYEARRQKLKAELSKAKVGCLLVSHAANRYYLSGFELHDGQCNESNGWLAITADGDDYLFTDPRYDSAAKRLWDEQNVVIYNAAKAKTVCDFLKGKGFSEIGFEPSALSVFEHEAMVKHIKLKPTQDLVEGLRVIKDEDELRRLEESVKLSHQLFDFIETRLEPGRTEREIAWDIEQFFRNNGAEEMAFSSIVGVGPNAALPHAVPDDTKLRENDLVLIDTGCRYLDYNSDQTRAFWIGDKPSDRFLEVKEMVMGAQQAAIDILRPGLSMVDGYLASWNYLDKLGVAEFFNHGLGHGIGLETHEAPRLSRLAKGTLKPGMVVTVEPGLYWPDWGGIRWEYDVVITEDGCRIL